VVVCTRNRVRYLERALDSLLAQEYPNDRYELIVVDNGSGDGTRSLVERYADRGPVPVIYLPEPRPGTSFARNAGAERARHELVAYLDDDTVAAPGWLAAFDVAVRQYGAVAGGGPVEPVLEEGVVSPTWWADPSIQAIFGLDHAHLCPDEPVTRIRWPLWLGGGNCFYAKRILLEHGGFRTDIGPVGGRYRVAEDIELNARLERSGVPIHYVREASIQHTITADRLNPRYIWMRSWAAGTTSAGAAAVLGNRSRAAGPVQLARAGLRLLLERGGGRTAAGSRLAYQLGFLRQRAACALQSVSRPTVPEARRSASELRGASPDAESEHAERK
jgi:glycosyltransferase involved in cell wall biosynthesis